MRQILSILTILVLCLGLNSCGSQDSTLTKGKRDELVQRSDVVVEAKFKKSARLRDLAGIDAAEGRPGYGSKTEYYVIFTVSKILKGKYHKEDLNVAISMPSLAFNMSPMEYSGQRLYTLYLKNDEKNHRFSMIGAEWVKRF